VLNAGEIAGIWEPFERENVGKCDRIGGLAFAASQRAPKKAPIRRWLPWNGTGRQWIPRREFLAGFLGISSDFADVVDVLGRLKTLLDGGPCRDRTYDQLIKRSQR
jgi:hypothetical protein